MIHQRFDLYSREGEILRADLRYEPTGEAKPAIIFLHGFKGFKDWGPFPAILEDLARSGFVTVAFNFSHNGIGEDLMTFTELDRFAENTFTRELEEVGDVVRAVAACESIPLSPVELDPNAIFLLGHSRGAAMAILAGGQRVGHASRLVRAVAALSPVSTYERYSERAKARWRAEGKFDVINQRTKQVMPINVTLLEDLEQHSEQLNILKAASEFPKQGKPLMLVCGSEDLITPLKETEAIAEAAKGPLTETHVIPRVGHTFGAEHPYKGMTEPLREVVELTKAFFR
jgi:pimeloyl-ACP methyl ester carboxylesterase